MLTIRLVTTIVHAILVVCTIIRPPGRGVAFVWTEVLYLLAQQCRINQLSFSTMFGMHTCS